MAKNLRGKTVRWLLKLEKMVLSAQRQGLPIRIAHLMVPTNSLGTTTIWRLGKELRRLRSVQAK